MEEQRWSVGVLSLFYFVTLHIYKIKEYRKGIDETTSPTPLARSRETGNMCGGVSGVKARSQAGGGRESAAESCGRG